MRTGDHVAESAEIRFAEPTLHGGEYAGDFAAAAENLGVIEDVLGLRDARDGNFFALQAFNAVSQHGSLACAGARDHQHGSVDVLDRFALPVVWSKWSGTGVRLRRQHWGQDITCR